MDVYLFLKPKDFHELVHFYYNLSLIFLRKFLQCVKNYISLHRF